MVRQTLTRELILKMAVEKWDGKFPLVTGGGSLPLLDLKALQLSESK